MLVKVYDRYRFAIPVYGHIVKQSSINDGIEVKLITTNSPTKYPVGSTIWVHKAQCKAVLKGEI